MSGFKNGRIILDEERDTYYAGQVLSGTLEFQLNQTLDFKAINFVFHGEATVSWEEEEVEECHGQRTYNTIQYGGQEVYFHVEKCVCGGVGVSQLQPGSHSIPFRFQIPCSVPSTFNDDPDDDEDEDGHISYYVKAVLQYSDGRESEELEEGFDVIVPVDLNLNPEMKVENEVIFEEALSSFFCGSGLLKATVCLPASGFCPGQTIPVRVEADNQSSVEVSRILFELVRRVTYTSTDPPSEKVEPETSLKITKTGAVPAKTKRRFTHYFDVPDMIPVITDNCSIISVQYFFKMKLILSGCNDPQEDDMEIFLGQIPIRELTDGDYKHPLQSDLPRAPVPNPNEPPVVIEPYIYPSHTLQVIPNHPAANAYPGNIAPAYAYPAGSAPINAPYPGAVPAYPGSNPSYPAVNPPYPGANPSYPAVNPPYPGANPSYPAVNPSYPGANPPYPGSNSSYPGANPPYPGANSNPPYPVNSSAYTPSPMIGFVTPGGVTSPPPGAGAPTPYNPSAPPE